MAQFRQSGTERIGDGGADQIGVRIPQRYAGGRIRRGGQRSAGHRKISVFAIAMILGVTLLVSASVLHFLFRDREVQERTDFEEAGSDPRPKLKRTLAFKGLTFGKGSDIAGGDSRYWERDDRRRDGDYNEESRLRREWSSSFKEQISGQDKSRDKGAVFQDSPKTFMESAEEYDDGIEIEDEEEDLGHASKTSREEKTRSSLKSKGLKSGKKMVGAKGSTKRPKYSGCEMKFLNSTELLVEPVESKKFSRFSLQYTDSEEEPRNRVDEWEPRFAGHQTLVERERSFYARDQKLNCGFINGTGFDLEEDDAKFMASCHIAVSSCIFGNSDRLRAPNSRMIKRASRKHVCFVMFVDEITLKTISTEGQKPDAMGFYGLWKVVVVKNLPYSDMRRVGKIPKFLSHRLFPTARYSIWLDSKLRLTSDPQLLLEYFLWRKGHEYAISNHYDRHCLWDEVMQNKKLNKYNHTLIDRQFEFYQSDGLKKFDPSDPNKLLPSNVPEGSFIVRAHTPMSNLFSCLWFNEVDRFTPRDQLSFAYTYMKLRRMNPDKPFYLNMFKDCERRAIAKLYHHRSEDKRALMLDKSAEE